MTKSNNCVERALLSTYTSPKVTRSNLRHAPQQQQQQQQQQHNAAAADTQALRDDIQRQSNSNSSSDRAIAPPITPLHTSSSSSSSSTSLHSTSTNEDGVPVLWHRRAGLYALRCSFSLTLSRLSPLVVVRRRLSPIVPELTEDDPLQYSNMLELS
jgi:hypothetical protein